MTWQGGGNKPNLEPGPSGKNETLKITTQTKQHKEKKKRVMKGETKKVQRFVERIFGGATEEGPPETLEKGVDKKGGNSGGGNQE